MLTVSLILTTFNCKDNLHRTLASIDEQDYPQIEVIIKDGASTDGTLDVIKNYADTHNNVKWVSGKDKGIYDAMNHGYSLATGDIIAFFNDLFTTKSAVSKYVQAIENGGATCVGVHSDLVYATDEKIVRYWKMGQGTIEKGWMPGHPTLYLRREIYEKYGLYDISYRVSADFEFMVRLLKNKELQLAYIPEVLIRMYYGGTSTQGIKGYFISVTEGHRALRKNGYHSAWWIIFLRTLKVMKQFKEKEE